MDQSLKEVLFRVAPFLLILLFLSIAIARKKISRGAIDLEKPRSWKNLVLWVVGFILYALLVEYSLHYFQLLKISPWEDTGLASIIKLLGICVLAPVTEELVFRGVALYWLQKLNLNIHAAILIQAFAFVGLHSFRFENSILENINILQVFTDAILYAYAMYFTKSLLTPMLMHSAGNTIAVIEQLNI